MDPDILSRIPPHDAKAEQGVLGSAMLLGQTLDDVALLIRPSSFYSDANGKIFAHLVVLHEEGKRPDVDLLVPRLKKAGELEAVGGPLYLTEVMQSVSVAAHAVHYAEIVRDKSILRQLGLAAVDIIQDVYDPSSDARDVMNEAERAVYAVRDERSDNAAMPIVDVLMEAMAAIDKRAEGGAVGRSTGFVDLDTMTGGLHNGELTLLAARPSIGKTAFAMNVSNHVAIDLNEPVLFASLEMSRLELAGRMLSARAQVDGHRIRNGRLSTTDREALVEAMNEMSQYPLHIDDTPSRTVSELAAVARRMKRSIGLSLMVVDYIQLITPEDKRAQRQEQVALIGRDLKKMARELGVPVLGVAQLNRKADEGGRPKLSHLRESGALEQDADVVLFIHREEFGLTAKEIDDKDLRGKAELIVSKQRNGPTGDVNLAWQKEFTRFVNLAPDRHGEFDQYETAY